MAGLAERARHAQDLRMHEAEAEYLRLVNPASPAGQAAMLIRRVVWHRFRVSGADTRIDWLVAPPHGSVAMLVLERSHRLACVIERQPVGHPRCRFWLDAWPGAVEVYTLADLAGLAGEPVAA